MANTFFNSDKFIDSGIDPALTIADSLGVTAKTSRATESEFSPGVGKKVTVRLPIDATAKNKVDGTDATKSDITQITREIEITDKIYLQHELESDELTYDLTDLNRYVITPMSQAYAEKAESIVNNALALGISVSRTNTLGNLVGTVGVASTTVDDFLEAEEAIFNARGSFAQGRMWGAFGPASKKSFSKELKNQSLDFGSAKANGLRTAMIGEVYNTNTLITSNGGKVVKGYRDTTVELDQLQVFSTAAPSAAVNDASAPGKATVIIDGLPTDGKILKGFRFQLTGETGSPIHVVIADAVITAGEATVTIEQVVAAGVADDAAVIPVEFLTDFVFNEGAVSSILLPPRLMPGDKNAMISRINEPGFPSVGVAFTMPGRSDKTFATAITIDGDVGAQTFGPQSCSIVNKVN